MTPGLSLPGKTNGRSIAPVASTTTTRRDPPMPLARFAARCDLLDRAENVVVVIAVDRRAGENADVRKRVQRRGGLEKPVGRIPLADLVFQIEPAAEHRRVVAEDHLGAGAASGKRRREPRRAAADDQHVAEGVCVIVAVRIGLEARLAESGGAADERLVEHPAAAAGTHEGLVVEAGGEEGRGKLINCAEIEAERRPGVLARYLQAVGRFDDRRLGVRLGRSLAEGHERVRLFRCRRNRCRAAR